MHIDAQRRCLLQQALILLPVSLCLFLYAMLPAAAQSPSMAVEMPLGGYYRAGHWIPVNCSLLNQGPPADVQISARTRDFGPYPAVRTFELNVALPSPANRRYSLYVMPPGAYVSRPLEVQLLHEGRVVAKQEQTLNPLGEADRLVAVITAQEGGFGGLAGSRTGAGRPSPPGYEPPGGPPGYGPPGRGQGQVQIAYVKPELAPDRALGYQIANLVVLSGIPSSALSTAQETALGRWVQRGGTLVVTGGVEPGALQTPALRALLPVEITGPVTLDSVGGLASPELGWVHHPAPPPGRFVAVACRPKPGAETVEARPGVPLLAEWSYGAGRVLFLAADPARPPLAGWDGLTDLWRHSLFHPSPGTQYLAAIDFENQAGAAIGSYGGYGRQPPPLANACLHVSQMSVPGFAFVGLFLLAYIVCLVPVNYFVLHRRDRRELAWLTTPAIVLGFSGLAYLVGYGTKGGQVILAQVGVVEAQASRGVGREGAPPRSGGHVVRDNSSEPASTAAHALPLTPHASSAPMLSYFGLFSPRKSRYDLAAEDGSVALTPVAGGSDAERRQLRVTEGESIGLRDVPIDMWDMGLFRGDGTVELGEGFQANLKLVGRKLTGTVTNRSPFDLEGAALLAGNNSPAVWGTFRRGETRSVDLTWSSSASGTVLPTGALATVRGKGASQSATDRMRYALIEPLTTWSPATAGASWTPPNHPVLIGWLGRPLVPVRVDGRRPRDQAAYLFLVHLPLK